MRCAHERSACDTGQLLAHSRAHHQMAHLTQVDAESAAVTRTESQRCCAHADRTLTSYSSFDADASPSAPVEPCRIELLSYIAALGVTDRSRHELFRCSRIRPFVSSAPSEPKKARQRASVQTSSTGRERGGEGFMAAEEERSGDASFLEPEAGPLGLPRCDVERPLPDALGVLPSRRGLPRLRGVLHGLAVESRAADATDASMKRPRGVTPRRGLWRPALWRLALWTPG